MSPPTLLPPRTVSRTARALARCLVATEKSANAYARAARRVSGAGELAAWLSRVAAERESFARVLRELLEHLASLLRASEFPELVSMPPEPLVPPPSTREREPSPPREEELASCDATDQEAQHAYEVCRSELARVDVPRDIRQRIDAQYAAVCNARFDLDRFLPRSATVPG